ncbi:MAG: hypothetical protein CVV64_13215 [Candidatus Wallbacteria bacterium HGW-Wallbacteria-1]|jgi:hypothetical protein|uniref:Tetratricopeptide repeat protein n=1 Tax=Candidatus Wallbacteria bacterium HGW-Wallbacteria-1 TaxID=2013854 RepID=A0A2N1PMX6_9BACT|nr:MAG: hypothetical protein CVV64_13215 [Candidatus Wallbacteria bacterium HGW-Wallbacteria-1]
MVKIQNRNISFRQLMTFFSVSLLFFSAVLVNGAISSDLPFSESIQLQNGKTITVEAGPVSGSPHLMEAWIVSGDTRNILVPRRGGVITDMALLNIGKNKPVAIFLVSLAGAMETSVFTFAIDAGTFAGTLVNAPDGDAEGIHSLYLGNDEKASGRLRLTLFHSPGPHWNEPVEFKTWFLSDDLCWKPGELSTQVNAPVKILVIGERAFMNSDWNVALAQYSKIIELDSKKPFQDEDGMRALEIAMTYVPGLLERVGKFREAMMAYEGYVDRYPSGTMADASQIEADFLDSSLRFAESLTADYFTARWAMDSGDRTRAFQLASVVADANFGDNLPYLTALIQRSSLLAARAAEIVGDSEAAIRYYRKCVAASGNTREAVLARQALEMAQPQKGSSVKAEPGD